MRTLNLSRVAIAAVLVMSAFTRAVTAADAPSPDQLTLIVPTAKAPVAIPVDDTASHSAWAKAVDAYMKTPAEQVKAHPAAADFPGAVSPDAKPVSREFDFPLNLPRWESTGLYAPPGAKVTVRVSPADVSRGMAVVIGAHTDSLLKLAKWVRFPRISRRFPITQATTVVANAFGGLVYIDMPRDSRLGGYHVATYGGYGWLDENPDRVPGVAHVSIDGAVPAPLFVAGQTTPQQWATQLKNGGAPWAELASDKVILTVESKHLSAVEDPSALLGFWGKVIDAEAHLAGWKKQPAPPERIVLDRDISAGWMHSAYPIMAHLASEHELLKLSDLQTKGSWGFFHELGHNHEAQACTFGSDYVEVNVNLFSMYVMEKVVGVNKRAHPSIKNLTQLLQARLGPQKKTDAWGNLSMYIVTIDAFGWDTLQPTLASYSQPGGDTGIRSRQQKIDQWVLRYSKATGHNLSRYYQQFDVNCSPSVLAELKPLPDWMPPAIASYAAASASDDSPTRTTTK